MIRKATSRLDYVPEPVRFEDADAAWAVAMGLVIAKCVARWATRYRASPVGHRPPVRQGRLPRDAAGRQGFVDELFSWEAEWLRQQPVELRRYVGMYLYVGSDVLLDQHDGVPASHLFLTSGQFATLKSTLREESLPTDLYFPVGELRMVEEPAALFGGVVLSTQAYSPGQGSRREASGAPPLRLPTEEERRVAIRDSCTHFSNALVEFMTSAAVGSALSDGVEALLASLVEALQRFCRRFDPRFQQSAVGQPPGGHTDAEALRSRFLFESSQFMMVLARRQHEVAESKSHAADDEMQVIDDLMRGLVSVRRVAYRM